MQNCVIDLEDFLFNTHVIQSEWRNYMLTSDVFSKYFHAIYTGIYLFSNMYMLNHVNYKINRHIME